MDKLSGGQTQRVRFALAIAGESDLIVLDEPTTAMDVEDRQAFWASMNAEVAEGRTLLFATHYLEEADQAADRILVINKGRLLADGTPAEIKARAGAKRVSFRLDQADAAVLRGLPAVVSLEIRHDLVQIQSADSDQTLYGLLDAGVPAPRHRGVRPGPGTGLPGHYGPGQHPSSADARRAPAYQR